MSTPPYAKQDQFMVVVVGWGAPGKKLMTKASERNAIAPTLTKMPALPRSNARSRRGCFRILRSATQHIEIRYEDSNAARPSDRIWLNATVEPMLMSENSTDVVMVKKTANYRL